MTLLASVITPVYKTPLPLFEEAFHSLEAQTCGFEQIEWLVAIHNMDDAYAESLKKVTGEQKNIVFLRVNRGNSVSVPRNCCLEHASGKYLFFLDSDDIMAPNCIQKTVASMEKSSAEIAVFNCDFLNEEGSVQFTKDYSLNAPNQELVVYEKGDPRIVSLLAEWGSMLWSRAYRRKFIQQSGISFDESLRYGEDVIFNMAAESLAEIICALPQLTGYLHRQWRRSLIQSEQNSESVEKTFITKIPTIWKHGATELLWFHLSFFVKKIVDKGLNTSKLAEICNELSPVLQRMRVMAPRFAFTFLTVLLY